jgi:hypothetical protein
MLSQTNSIVEINNVTTYKQSNNQKHIVSRVGL